MWHVRSTSLLPVCIALAACAEPTPRREIMAPDAVPLFALGAPRDERVFPLDGSGAEVDLARATVADSRAASGGRATGLVDVTYLSSRQTYSLTALSTAPTSSAKGRIRVSIVNASFDMEIDASVDCMLAVGNEAWVSGPIARFVFKGVEYPVRFHLLVRVQDNGEGNVTPDLASPPFGARPQACLLARALPLLPNGGGNIQVEGR